VSGERERALWPTPTAVRQQLPSLQKIPHSVSADVKTLLQKFHSILRTGDVKLTPTHGAEHHIHIGSHPPRKIPPPRSGKTAN
jgi:hypothetical protein